MPNRLPTVLAAALLCAAAPSAFAEPPGKGKLVRRVYPVAGLVLPAAKRISLSAGSREAEVAAPKRTFDNPVVGPCPGDAAAKREQNSTPANRAEYLIEVLTADIAPESWAKKGGAGTMEYDPLEKSLVVNQTEEVQDQLAGLLWAMTWSQGIEVTLETRLLLVPGGTFAEDLGRGYYLRERTEGLKRLTCAVSCPVGARVAKLLEPGEPNPVTLDDQEVLRLIAAAESAPRTSIMQAPKLTMFDGQIADIELSAGGEGAMPPADLSVRPKLSADRRSVKLELTAEVAGKKTKQSLTVPDGGTLLLGGWKVEGKPAPASPPTISKIPYLKRLFKNAPAAKEPQYVLLMVTPRIVVSSEEEEKVGTPVGVSSGCARAGAAIGKASGASAGALVGTVSEPEPKRADAPCKGKLVQRAYAVADLVIPIPERVSVRVGGRDACAWREAPQPSAPKAEDLIKLITSTVKPHSWSGVGGVGTAEYFPAGMNLVVNQTADAQEEVADLLAALRRLQEVEVSLETRLLLVSGGTFVERVGVDFEANVRPTGCGVMPVKCESTYPAGPTVAKLFEPGGPKSVMLTDKEVFMLLEAAQGDRRTNIMQAPKLTMFDGQTADFDLAATEGGMPATLLTVQPIVSADRRFVKMSLAAEVAGKKMAQSLALPDGGTLLLGAWKVGDWKRTGDRPCDASPPLARVPYLNRLFRNLAYDREPQYVLLMVTPRIIINAEEEEKVGTPVGVSSGCAAAGAAIRGESGGAVGCAACGTAAPGPKKADSLTIQDVAKMKASGVGDGVIVNQIRLTGAVFRLSADDICWLAEHGVSDRVIKVMQRTARKAERSAYSSDPNIRMSELLNQSEDLRQIEYEKRRIWTNDQPSHLTPERVHGAVMR